MKLHIKIIISLIILLLLLLLFFVYNIHNTATVITFQKKENMDPSLYTNFPFWNTQLGSKRNMSYDLRGDVPIPYHMVFPFNMSTRIPIMNKPLSAVS